MSTHTHTHSYTNTIHKIIIQTQWNMEAMLNYVDYNFDYY